MEIQPPTRRRSTSNWEMYSTPRVTAPSSRDRTSRRYAPVALIDPADRLGDDMIVGAGVDSLAGAVYMTGYGYGSGNEA